MTVDTRLADAIEMVIVTAALLVACLAVARWVNHRYEVAKTLLYVQQVVGSKR